MACIIHYKNQHTYSKLTSPVSKESWNTLLDAAKIRNHQPILKISENLSDDEVPSI